jgi:thioesterase domain-containing protein
VPLARALGPDRPFYAFQQFELSAYQAPLPSVEAMAAAYADAVREVRPAGPYVLAGMCSTGAYVAYEMAQRIRALGEEISLVALFDPSNSEVADECRRSRAMVEQALEVASRIGEPSGDGGDGGSDGGPHTQLAELTSALGLDADILRLAPRSLRQFFELFASNHNASLTYSPGPYEGRACVFVPSLSRKDDRLLSDDEWKALVPGIEVHAFPVQRRQLYSDREIVTQVAAILTAAVAGGG